MKRYFIAAVLLTCVLAFSACSTTTEYRYEKDAVRLHLKSDPQLNLYRGGPHTLVLCVYYLRDPNAFNQTLDEKDGLSKLLECTRLDPSVVSTKRVIVQPGQDFTEVLDRTEGARYVGVTAGYYFLERERAARLFSVPLAGFSNQPSVLNIDLYLGPQGIQGAVQK